MEPLLRFADELGPEKVVHLEEKIRDNTRAMLERTTQDVTPRQAATQLAVERVRAAMRYRRS